MEYTRSYRADAELDCEYRRLADHARMISVCLADGVFPASRYVGFRWHDLAGKLTLRKLRKLNHFPYH